MSEYSNRSNKLYIYAIKENNVASINDISKEERVTLDTKFGA